MMNVPLESMPLEPKRPELRLDWFYPGTVVDTEDPLKRGHVKVRVPQVYGDPDSETEFIQDRDLPWAIPSWPTHDAHVPSVGDGVWVSFWGGSEHYPIWHGQFYGDGDAPAEWESAHDPVPKTRIIYTESGHRIELRWISGEEQIRVVTAGGCELNLKDADALGGPLIEGFTPAGRKFALDDKQQLARINTPTQTLEMLDTGNLFNLTTPGTMTADSSDKVLTAARTVAITAGTSLTISAATLALILTGASATVTAVGAALAVTVLSLALVATAAVTIFGLTVALGSVVGVNRQFIVLASFLAKYSAHDHGGAVGAPSAPYELVTPTDQTVFTQAD